MQNLISYMIVQNLLDPTSVKTGTYQALVRLDSFLDELCGKGTWSRYTVRVNKVKDPSPKTLLLPGDHVSVITMPGAPLTILAIVGAVLAIATIGYSVYQYIQMKAQMNKLKDQRRDLAPESLSQAYGFDVKENYRYDGESIAVLFGETKLGGTVINQHIHGSEEGGNTETLKLILGVAEGELDSLATDGAEDIFLDDTPLSQFTDYEYAVKLGAAADTAFSDMDELYQQWFLDLPQIKSTGIFLDFENSSKDNKAYNYHNYVDGYRVDDWVLDMGTAKNSSAAITTARHKFGSASFRLGPGTHCYNMYHRAHYLHQPRSDPFALSWWIWLDSSEFTALSTSHHYNLFWVNTEGGRINDKMWQVRVKKYTSTTFEWRFIVLLRAYENDPYYTYTLDIRSSVQDISDYAGSFHHIKFCRDGDYIAWFKDGVDITDRSTEKFVMKDQNEICTISNGGDFGTQHFVVGSGIIGLPCWLDEVRLDVSGNVSYKNFTPPTSSELSDLDDLGRVWHDARGTADQVYFSYRFPQGCYWNKPSGPDRLWSLYREWFVMSGGAGDSMYLYNHNMDTYAFWEEKKVRVVYGQATGPLTKTYRIPFDYITVDHQSGRFQFGETIEGGNSGDMGELTGVTEISASEQYMYLRGVSEGDFSAGETVTGHTSGATATVKAGGAVIRRTSYDTLWSDRRSMTWSNSYWTNLAQFHSVTECRRFTLIYPRLAKLFLKISAQGGLTKIPRVNVIGARNDETLYRWTGSALTTISGTNKCTNPAWVVWEILTDGFYDSGTRYGKGWGRGVHPKYLDYTSFSAWATYCNTTVDGVKRAKFGGVFDVKGKRVWDCLDIAAVVGRGRLNLIGNKYYVSIDQPTSPANTPIYVFSAGNTYNTRLTWIDPVDKPDKIVIEFLNEENKYAKDDRAAERSDFDELTTTPNTDTIFVPGITNADQAKREATLRLQLARSMERKIEFETDVEGLVIQPGDTIAFQHESNKYTFGGRIVDLNTSSKTITIDREITLDSSLYSGDCYIYIRQADDDVVKYTITGPFDTLTDEFDTSESPYGATDDPFAIYRSAEDEVLYTVDEITITDEQKVKIVAYNYDDSAFYHADWASGATPI